MKNDNLKSKREDDSRENENPLEDIPKEHRELIKYALKKMAIDEIRIIKKQTSDMELSPPSKRHKIHMNRFFREHIGSSFLPYPEVDHAYERIRSKIIRMLCPNALRKHRKK